LQSNKHKETKLPTFVMIIPVPNGAIDSVWLLW